MHSNIVCLAGGPAGIQLVEVADPTLPRLLATDGSAADAWNISISGDLAAVAGGKAGLHLFDLSNPLVPRRVGGAPRLSAANAVAFAGPLVLVANGSSGLEVIAPDRRALIPRLSGEDRTYFSCLAV